MQGRLHFLNDDDESRAKKLGIEDLKKKYDIDDMVKGDVIFCATGVTDGNMLKGVRKFGNTAKTESVVMRSSSGTSRKIIENPFSRAV